MKLVSIQSPYAGNIERNLTYACRALEDSLKRGEAPFASHLMYPTVLADNNPEERALGLECDYSFMAKCDLVAFYMDFGHSDGMEAAAKLAGLLGIPIEMRQIGV